MALKPNLHIKPTTMNIVIIILTVIAAIVALVIIAALIAPKATISAEPSKSMRLWHRFLTTSPT